MHSDYPQEIFQLYLYVLGALTVYEDEMERLFRGADPGTRTTLMLLEETLCSARDLLHDRLYPQTPSNDPLQTPPSPL